MGIKTFLLVSKQETLNCYEFTYAQNKETKLFSNNLKIKRLKFKMDYKKRG